MGKASLQVEKWVAESKQRLRAVRNTSVQLLINDAQLPIAKGGRMRVDTGFLRASGQLSLTGMPTGLVRGVPDADQFRYDDGERTTPVQLILAQASLGTDIYWGWTAGYARVRESHDAFLRLAVQKWPDFVAQAVRMARTGIRE